MFIDRLVQLPGTRPQLVVFRPTCSVTCSLSKAHPAWLGDHEKLDIIFVGVLTKLFVNVTIGGVITPIWPAGQRWLKSQARPGPGVDGTMIGKELVDVPSGFGKPPVAELA